MRLENRKAGIAFFITLALLNVIALICAAIAMMVLRDSYTVVRMKNGMQAYFLAQSGIEDALVKANADFDSIPGSFSGTLDSWTYNVNVSTKPADSSRKKIVSTGVVRGITKTITVQVHRTGPDAFNYPALGGGKLTVAGGSVVSNSGLIDIHSNSPASSGAVQVGARKFLGWPLVNTGIVVGNASACGHVDVYNDGVSAITGTITNNAPYVELPPFDDNFFRYYYNLAFADDNVKSGLTIFTSDPCAGKPNHVVYVIGQARLVGTWTMTGCIVATGKIVINKWASGKITQHQWQNLPAFMSLSDVEIYDPIEAEGMIYANGFIEIDSFLGSYGPTKIYGALYGKSWVNIKSATELHYRCPNPPGLPGGSGGIEITSWSAG